MNNVKHQNSITIKGKRFTAKSIRKMMVPVNGAAYGGYVISLNGSEFLTHLLPSHDGVVLKDRVGRFIIIMD